MLILISIKLCIVTINKTYSAVKEKAVYKFCLDVIQPYMKN